MPRQEAARGRRFWINTISRDHIRLGIAGNFTQAGHGRLGTLEDLTKGDLIAFYSPRTQLNGGDVLQSFTAVGRVTDDEPWQVEVTPAFRPWRRQVAFLPSQEAPIRPLLEDLSFIPDKQRWGFPFRRGLFELSEADFRHIARAMGVAID